MFSGGREVHTGNKWVNSNNDNLIFDLKQQIFIFSGAICILKNLEGSVTTNSEK